MIKIIDDTLKIKGKWSQKRVTTFSSFFSAFFYAFIPLYAPSFDVKEFVFLGFLAVGGFSIYRQQKRNENIINNETQEDYDTGTETSYRKD